MKKAKKVGAGFLAATMLTAALAPCAFAADVEPYVDGSSTPDANAQAQTQVYLQADDSQLHVTAPTKIVFAIDAAGTLFGPTTATIDNGSIFPVAVKSITVADTDKAKGVSSDEFDAATDDNVYYIDVRANGGDFVDFAVSTPTLNADWNMTKTETTGEALELYFDGKIKNVTTDFTAETQVSNVTWTFSAAANS